MWRYALRERFLMDVLGILLRAGQVHGEAQDCLIVLPHQNIESRARAFLRFADQFGVLYPR